MIKKLGMFALMSVLTFNVPNNVYANESNVIETINEAVTVEASLEEVAPFTSLYIATYNGQLFISGNRISIDYDLQTFSTGAAVSINLQEKNGSSWTTVATFSDSVTNTYPLSVLRGTRTYNGSSSKEYRAVFTFDAYESGRLVETRTLTRGL